MNRSNLQRRLFLKGGLATGSLFLSAHYAWVWAQSEGVMKLFRAPKIALVIGNSKYIDSPLKNPANDAAAIAETLKLSGFSVTLNLDANRAEMASAVQAYVLALSARKAVGVFYYAGHGAQLAWRNYILPTDMDIQTVADIPKQGIDVNSLIDGLKSAANPMNVIILDACRNNPFGTFRNNQFSNLKELEQKGLSQMDAPANTLLAYATSPGNVASDGEGVNGLYTENLLREIKVKEAKIEEVFKRVRLNVRLKSKGTQIPWESTSLEEDFWFQPPAELKKISEAELIRLLDEEAAIWNKAKASKDPKQLEAYLLRYPTGSFSELAQLEIDRALAKEGEKKIEIVNMADNPFTKGSVTANTNYKVGDSYTLRDVDIFSRVESRRFTFSVTQITDDEVHFDNRQITDLLGNIVKFSDGRNVKGNQSYPLEYSVGKRWNSRFVSTSANGRRAATESESVITAREKIVVPAGTFEAYRIESRSFSQGGGRGKFTLWMAPPIREPVAREEQRTIPGRETVTRRVEMVSYKQQ